MLGLEEDADCAGGDEVLCALADEFGLALGFVLEALLLQAWISAPTTSSEQAAVASRRYRPRA